MPVIGWTLTDSFCFCHKDGSISVVRSRLLSLERGVFSTFYLFVQVQTLFTISSSFQLSQNIHTYNIPSSHKINPSIEETLSFLMYSKIFSSIVFFSSSVARIRFFDIYIFLWLCKFPWFYSSHTDLGPLEWLPIEVPFDLSPRSRFDESQHTDDSGDSQKLSFSLG